MNKRETDVSDIGSATNWRRTHDAALNQARCHGLGQDDAEDFACEFAVYSLEHPDCPAAQSNVAANWYAEKRTLDEMRRRQFDQIHQIVVSQLGYKFSMRFIDHSAYRALDDCTHLAQHELSVGILESASRLDQAQRELFDLSFLADLNPHEIATKTGRTPHAIRQALSAIRKQIRASLSRRGITNE